MKKALKQIVQWVMAIVLALCISNVFLGFYFSTTGWILRDKGSTFAIYYPNSYIVHGTEGYGIHKIDSRGYVNDVDKLADNYVVAIGASFTQGKEIAQGKRYTDLLNKWMGYTDTAYVYNVSQDGYYFPEIVNGFTSLTKEFPDSSKIIIEIGRTVFSPEELKQALSQRDYSEKQRGDKILSNYSDFQKTIMSSKRFFPLMYNINNQLKAIDKKEAKSEDNDKIDLVEYKKNLDEAMKLITKVYDGEIIIMYHPSVEINNDGMVVIEKDTDKVFEQSCKENGIRFVNTKNSFSEAYKKDYSVPYGFSNTAIGTGHLNETGHYLIAKDLLSVLNEGNK